MERTFKLAVPSSTENLSMIRDFVVSIGQRAGLEPAQVAKLELAVDEGCANVIEHAYSLDISKEVSVCAKFNQDAVHILIIDTGKGFDPSSVEQQGLESMAADRKSGGLGMRLMKSLMDEVHYEMIPGVKNELRMVMRLRK